MGEERKDSVLWGKGFQSWRYSYETLRNSIKAIKNRTGVSSAILGSTQGVERHPQLEEMKLTMMEIYMEAAQDPRIGAVKRKRGEFEAAKEANLSEIMRMCESLFDILQKTDEIRERPKADTGDRVADVWDDVAYEEGVVTNPELDYLEGKVAEICADLKRFLESKSSEVRLAAAEALAEARDVHTLVKYAFNEVFAENRARILDKILVAVRLGAVLGSEEKSMLLKMTEDMDGKCAEKAWAIALKLFGRNELNDEQIRYLMARQTIEDGEERADAAKMAGLRLKLACSEEKMEPVERASLFARVEEAVWLGAVLRAGEIGMLVGLIGKAEGQVACAAWGLMMELLGKDALGKEEIAELLRVSENIADGRERKRMQARLEEKMPAEDKKAEPEEKAGAAAPPVVGEIAIGTEESAGEAPAEEAGPRVIEIDDNSADEAEKPAEVRVIVMDDEDIPIDPLSQAMGQLERGELGDGQVTELVLLADAVEDKDGRKRVFDKILMVLGPGKHFRDERADGILNVERMSRVFLETVRDERPSGVPMRKSQPPAANGKRDSVPPAEKVLAKG